MRRREYGWLFYLGFAAGAFWLALKLAEAAGKAFENPRYRREVPTP